MENNLPGILSYAWVQCISCHHPMIGIRNIEARDTCHGCGGHSLIAHLFDKPQAPQRVLKEKPFRHRARINAPGGGSAA